MTAANGDGASPTRPSPEDEGPGLPALAAAALARDPARPAIEYEGRWYDWGDLRHIADRVAALIAASGLAPDAPVTLVPRNRPAMIAALFGLIAAGRTVRMVYAFQSDTGIARDIRACDAGLAIIAAEDRTDALVAALRADGIALIELADDARAVPGCETGRHEPAAPAPPAPRIEILTSGTTGPPKRFALGFDVIARHLVAGTMTSTSAVDAADAIPVLLFMPLGNISGIYVTLPPLIAGMRVMLVDRFTIPGWLDHVRRYRPTRTGIPPSSFQAAIDADIPAADLASLEAFGAGAAPLDPTVHARFEEKYGIPILLSYGATEFAGPVAAMTPALHAEWGKAKLGSVGRAMPGARLRIVDPQSGTEVPPGTEGLLEVVSPRIGPDWIRTSDIAVIDADGFLYHRGRADGAIVRGGFKLLPETIERALLRHPAVAAAAVIAVEHPRLGQVPGAVVAFRPGAAHPSIDDLKAHLRDHVYKTHIPEEWRFVEAMPMTPSMKVSRPAIAALF